MADGDRLALSRAIAIGAVLALAACGSPPAPPPAHPVPAAPPRVTEVRVLPGAIDGRSRLAADAARASAAGAGPLRVLGAEVVAEGDRVGAFVEIPEDECLLAFARPSATLADVDLFAYDDDGSIFAADESPDPQAALLACPPHPRRLFVTARAMAGTGILAVGVQSVPRAAADAVAGVMSARGRPGEDSGRLDAWPGLETRLREHRASLGGRWEDVRRSALSVDPRAASRVTATIEPGRCLDVLVIPRDEVAAVEVVVEDSAARIVARAREQGRDRALVFCAAAPATLSIAVRPRGTPGLAAVILGRSALGGEAEIADRARVVHLSQTRDLEAARAALATELAPLGYGAPRALAAGTARVGSRTAVALDLPAGCSRLDVIAGKPLVELAATLWDDRGTRIADGRAGASLPLFACGLGGAMRLDLEAVESPGPFAVELRADRAAPAVLLAHPVAAGRLLARMNAGGGAADAAGAATAVVVGVEEGKLRSVPVPVALGQCVEVIAALDAGAAGLDLRLADGAGEGALTQARYVVADRLCAGPGGRAGAAELRLLAGKGEALVLLRTVGR